MVRHAIITGGAGFIGSHLVDLLLAEGGWQVTVVDNFDPLYPRAMKEANISAHAGDPAFELVEGDILDDAVLDSAFARSKGQAPVVIHLAARVGVRPSLKDPIGYHQVNVTGTLKLLEKARRQDVEHFVLASSSSVYGEAPDPPWRETVRDLVPISPYAATKLAAEQFLQVHSRLYGMRSTVLRFFTVHGPRQRPDLAIHAFFRRIAAGQPLPMFGDGSTGRDYTFVKDIVHGVRGAVDRPVGGPEGGRLFEIFNLGNSHTVILRELIAAIEEKAGRKAIIDHRPSQPGDVPFTCADIGKASAHFGYSPRTTLEEGLERFHAWQANGIPRPV